MDKRSILRKIKKKKWREGEIKYRTNQENRLLMSNSTFMLTAFLTAH